MGCRGVFMDLDKWDESDVFLVPGLGVTLCVSIRVAKLLSDAALTNIKLMQNDQYSF